eukprot:7388892-Prymnesium_polylepis.1
MNPILGVERLPAFGDGLRVRVTRARLGEPCHVNSSLRAAVHDARIKFRPPAYGGLRCHVVALPQRAQHI